MLLKGTNNMMSTYLFTISATLFIVTSGQIDECPRVCRCDGRKSVYCNERQMDLIPYGIPTDTQTVYLQINNITNGLITDEILSSLIYLKKLDLHQNRLTSVPNGLPSSLNYVDFRNNDIRYVGKTSLSGLTSLTELHLDGNNITNKGLSPFAFQDSHKLNMLVLSNNLLTELPENLPNSLRILRLEKNLIRRVTAKATRDLDKLINLDLSLNVIIQTAIEPGALRALVSLRSLDLSRNHLTETPLKLPESLEELVLSNNKIEFIFNSENNQHGSLTTLKNLNRVDFSSNNIKSVQVSSFAYLNLDSVALHDNPWQCDCHLRYFKQWLSNDKSTLSSESNIRCRSPSAFSGVTLNSIDEEALACESRLRARKMMTVVDITPNGFTLLWKASQETPDPTYIKRSIMYGPLKCGNCSIEKDFSEFDRHNEGIVKYLENYSSQDITTVVQINPLNASIGVSRLQSESHYAVCVFDSEQNDDDVLLNQCRDFWTSTEISTSSNQDDVIFLPIWLIVMCCVIVLVLLIAVIGVIAWRKRNALKSKTPGIYLTNRDELYYRPPQISGLPTVGYRQTRLGHNYGTAMADRTYAECGPASTAPRTLGDSAIDAQMEFEVFMKPDDNTAPKRIHTPMSSLDSECQENSTMSTNQTGRNSATHDQGASPPPTYDSLHSYTPLSQREALANHFLENSQAIESLSYV